MRYTFLACVLVTIICIGVVLCQEVAKEARSRRQNNNRSTRKISIVEGNIEERRNRRRNKKNKAVIRHPFTPLTSDTAPAVETYNGMFQSPTLDYRRTQCKVIPTQFALCYDIGYTKMHLPNLHGHDSIDELLKQSNEWTPLLATRCHPETRKFLCSIFAPVCVEDFSKPIPPCRSLCEVVRDGCSPAMARFAYPWPPMLNCTQFPTDDTLCIPSEAEKRVTPHTTLPAARTCSPCRQKKISSSFKNKICSFDFIMKSRVKLISYHKGNTKILLEKKSRKVIKWLDQVDSKSAAGKMPKKNIVWMRDGLNCTCDILTDGIRANYLMAGWREGNKLKLYSITKWRKSDKRISKLLKRKNCSMHYAKNKRSGTQ